MTHNIYRGWRILGAPTVTKNGALLGPGRSLRLRNHSPAGFNWGYGGSGPAQLALAILLEELEDDELALTLYQDFKFAVVAGWEGSWSLTSVDIRAWLERAIAADACNATGRANAVDCPDA